MHWLRPLVIVRPAAKMLAAAVQRQSRSPSIMIRVIVVAWHPSWPRFCNKVGFDNIDDTRNGLLLFKPIEWAFDNSKLSIVPDTTFNPPKFQVGVLV